MSVYIQPALRPCFREGLLQVTSYPDLLERVDQLVLERQEASMTKDMDRRDAGGWQVGS